MQNKIHKKRRSKELLAPFFRSSVLAAGLISGYYQRVFAGTCSLQADGTYLCSGAASATGTDTEQSIAVSAPLTITTSSGFGLNTTNDTTGGTQTRGLELYSAGDIVLTDNEASSITGKNDGIFAHNDGLGSISIITSGSVTGATGYGIDIKNGSSTNHSGSDLTLVATGDVYGQSTGIRAQNYGTGSVSITSTGTITGMGDNSVEARGGIFVNTSSYSKGVKVSVNNVYGGTHGIKINNSGTGTTSVAATGNVTATLSGIELFAMGDSLSLTTSGVVYGGDNGIFVGLVKGGGSVQQVP